jgi:SAM-dependent methyltransferase
MLSALKKYLLVPKLVKLSSAAPKDPQVAWDQYWGRVRATGACGDVLWDSGDDHELLGYLEHLKRQLNPDLPLVDVGCGNGTFSRRLAAHFPHVLGVDVSANAIARARAESEGLDRISYLAADMTAPGAARSVAAALAAAGAGGEANIFIRGVLHVMKRRAQAALAEQLLPLAGKRGRVFLAETDFRGNAVEYVSHLGATLHSIPAPLRDAIRDLPMPGHFGPVQRLRAFPESRWDVVEDGPAVIETLPLKSAVNPERIPGYFAVLQAR